MELHELVKKIDIAEYIQQYVELAYNGDAYFGLCCFHEEQTPSMNVDPHKQLFYCFGCGKGGDALTFIRDYHKFAMPQAIQHMKDYLGIGDDVVITKPSETIMEMKKFTPKTPSPPFKPRVLPYTYLEQFEDWEISPWATEDIDIALVRKYLIKRDLSQERIIIPIHDVYGGLINVSGRAYNPRWKELLQRKYTYYNKMGKLEVLWGYHYKKNAIQQKGEVILVEGVKSVLKLEAWGYDNVLALLTSNMSDFQLQKIIELQVDVVIALDKNVNIWRDKGIKRQIAILQKFCNVYNIYDKDNQLGAKDAPCDKGNAVWETLYNRAKGEVPCNITT